MAQRDDRVRLLAIVTAGDFMSNTPLEFLVEDGAIALRFLYVAPGEAFPDSLPDHDVAFVAIAEGDRNRAVLEQIETAVATWPRPVLNLPGAIARLTRDGAFRLLKDAPGLVYPVNAAVTRGALEAVVRGATAIETLLDGASYPVLLRPRGTHAGEGLAKIDDAEALAAFLSSQAVDEFYLAQFVDYRSPDGLFRKFRLLFIGDAPYAAHLAISGDWMIHYLNAQMHEERHRAEEALFFERFDDDFAARHRAALTEVARRMQLDYFAIDCGETRDGRLLLFEVGTAMIVHSLDFMKRFPISSRRCAKCSTASRPLSAKRATERSRSLRPNSRFPRPRFARSISSGSGRRLCVASASKQNAGSAIFCGVRIAASSASPSAPAPFGRLRLTLSGAAPAPRRGAGLRRAPAADPACRRAAW